MMKANAETLSDEPLVSNNQVEGEKPTDEAEHYKVQGYLEGITANSINGWAWIPGLPDEHVEIELTLDGKVIKSVMANQYREDLAAAGLGHGDYGFSLKSEKAIDWNKVRLEIKGFEGQLIGGSASEIAEKVKTVVKAKEPMVHLTYFPDYSITNPYQKRLVGSLPGNWQHSPGKIDDAIDKIRNNIDGDGHVFHLHWLNPVFSNAPSVWAAERQKDEFIGKLKEFTALGGTVIWTIHNVLSHDRRYEDVERSLSQSVADIAAKVHVHSQLVIEEIKNEYSISADKVIVLPHPNYIDVYQNYITPKVARDYFKIPDDTIVFSFIGQLRPYKGLRELIEAFRKLKREFSNIHLLISGKPVHPYNSESIRQLTSGVDDCTVVSDFIPDDQLQLHFNATDFVVLPYLNVLTSGSVLNALSFSRPVIAPCMGVLPETIVNGKNGWLYDPEDNDALYNTMRACLSKEILEQRETLFQNAKASVEHLTWKDFSRNLASAVSEKMEPDWTELEVAGSTRKVKVTRSSHDRECKRDAAIIILNYGHYDDVQRLVSSIETGTNKSFELFLVDNDSPNLSYSDFVSFTSKLACPITYVRVDHNGGYALGNNVGISIALQQQFDFIWVLNPDIVMEKQALDILVETAVDNPECKVFGSAIYVGGVDNKVWSAGGRLNFKNGLDAGHLYGGMDKNTLPSTPYAADYVTGASLFCRPEIFSKVGLIPEDYFLYFEETDWCQRVRASGEEILVEPRSELYHFKRSESGGLPSHYYFYYFIRNAIRFTNQHEPAALEITKAALKNNFITPWLERIAKRAPNKLEVYQKISAAALVDASDGVSGSRELSDLFAPEDAVVPSTSAMGFIDAINNGTVIGWAYDALNPEKHLDLAVLLDGQFVGFVKAEQYREDLEAAGYKNGNCAFRFKLPNQIDDGERHVVEVRMVNGGSIAKRVLISQVGSDYKGRMDGVSGYMIRGWFFNKANVNERPVVEVVFDNKGSVLGRADSFRADLLKAGIGNGKHGFEIRLPAELLDGQEHEFKLKLPGDNRVLAQRKIKALNPVSKLPVSSLKTQLSWLSRHREFAYDNDESLELLKYFCQTEKSFVGLARKIKSEKLVSVVMPAFNRETTIEVSIRSVLEQTYENFELIIVDDGSTDQTVSVVRDLVEELGESRIKLVVSEKNAGVSAARNRALAEAKGDFIAYLDSDNTWKADYLKVMVTALYLSPETDSAYCGQTVFQVLQTPEGPVDNPVMIRTGPFSLSLMENRNYIDLNCFIHRRAAYEKLGGFNESMRRLVDWELIWRYSYIKSPKFVPVLLSDYFMAKAENQITHLESYERNFQEIQRIFNEERPLLDKHVFSSTCPEFDLDLIMLADESEGSYLFDSITSALLALNNKSGRLTVMVPDGSSIEKSLRMAFGSQDQLAIRSYEDSLLAVELDAFLQKCKGDCVLMSGTARIESNTLAHLKYVSDITPSNGMILTRRLKKLNGQGLAKLSPYASCVLSYDQVVTSSVTNKVPSLYVNHIYESQASTLFCSFLSAESLKKISLEECLDTDRDGVYGFLRSQFQFMHELPCYQAARAVAYDID
ncbi:glycosyltransferase [Pseudomaricurvus alcaniphilus]|uniref:glycosyltransferase n=1 Tax=Pseudomaricurvus alcaniphilus TaxID=1166482 RepID=UPI00140AF7F1|nr:glycosyltransferase [Pseudomaricurvus alcaniphilus]NHN37600.1 glycosyltransferase [Pseudomaricurvus alcaniphilus]